MLQHFSVYLHAFNLCRLNESQRNLWCKIAVGYIVCQEYAELQIEGIRDISPRVSLADLQQCAGARSEEGVRKISIGISSNFNLFLRVNFFLSVWFIPHLLIS